MGNGNWPVDVNNPSRGPIKAALVSDFDGTMTKHDFYKLAIATLLPAETPDFWSQYRSGTITHFEALRHYFAAIPATENEVLAVVRQMGLDPNVADAVHRLQQAGWEIVITSAGCEWYIRQLLSDAGVEVAVHANPGRFNSGSGLMMEMPRESPFLSPTLGIDKTAVVRQYLSRGYQVAFAGDGFPDAAPARLVEDHLRFARGDLADVFSEEGLPYIPFETWSEIPAHLLGQDE